MPDLPNFFGLGAAQCRLEVKTFTAEGRVVVTSGELQEAAVAQESYFLIGVLDDGKPEHQWSTFVLPNPIEYAPVKGRI